LLPYVGLSLHAVELMREVERGLRPSPMPSADEVCVITSWTCLKNVHVYALFTPWLGPQMGEAYVELIETCWQHEPRLRPSFEEVVGRLSDMENMPPLAQGAELTLVAGSKGGFRHRSLQAVEASLEEVEDGEEGEDDQERSRLLKPQLAKTWPHERGHGQEGVV
jgi:hypothetical protein